MSCIEALTWEEEVVAVILNDAGPGIIQSRQVESWREPVA
jgi:hypothetical protein